LTVIEKIFSKNLDDFEKISIPKIFVAVETFLISNLSPLSVLKFSV